MPHIILLPGDERLSVMLCLDIRTYCVASKKIMQNAPDTPLEEQMKDQETFEMLRAELGELTNGLSGDLHWVNIKRLLKAQCDPKTLVEKQLAAVLDGSNPDKPHALYTLDSQFIELLKNSTDAIVRRVLSDASDATALEMTIKLEIDDANMSVIITDNAGGFASDYLAAFTDMVASGAYRQGRRVSEKSEDSAFYLGGRGLGLRQICGMHMAGELWIREGAVKTHIIPASSPPKILLRNSTRLVGAEIVVTSPLEPLTSVSLEREGFGGEMCLPLPFRAFASPLCADAGKVASRVRTGGGEPAGSGAHGFFAQQPSASAGYKRRRALTGLRIETTAVSKDDLACLGAAGKA